MVKVCESTTTAAADAIPALPRRLECEVSVENSDTSVMEMLEHSQYESMFSSTALERR